MIVVENFLQVTDVEANRDENEIDLWETEKTADKTVLADEELLLEVSKDPIYV